jgi:hypothetical protein
MRVAAVLVILLVLAGRADARVEISSDAMPDLEALRLTAAEVECDWRPGVQAARVAVAVRDDAADVAVGLGVRPTRSTRVAVVAAAGAVERAELAHGSIAMTADAGIGPTRGLGVDLAIAGWLERTARDIRALPMPMRPYGGHERAGFDVTPWITSRHSDHGWAVMPLSYGLDVAEYGRFDKKQSASAVAQHAVTHRLGAAVALRGYEAGELANGTVAARVDAAFTELTSDLGGDSIEHVRARLTLDGAATSATPLPLPGLPMVRATALALDLGLGFAVMRNRARDQHATIFDANLGVVFERPGGTILGAGVSVGPSHTADATHLARLWRIEARAGTCAGPVCGEARAALGWLEALDSDAADPSRTEHLLSGRTTYALTRTLRVGLDYRVSRIGIWDHSLGAVLELGGRFGGPAPRAGYCN